MQALPCAPADLPSAGPPVAASAKAGQEGLFASHLKTAAQQQTTNAERPTDSGIKPSAPHGDDRSAVARTVDNTGKQDDQAALETSLNGSAGAALQTLPAEPKAEATALEAGLNGNLGSVQNSESAVTRMLNALTAAGTNAGHKNGAETPLTHQHITEQQAVFTKNTDDSIQPSSQKAPLASSQQPPLQMSAAPVHEPGAMGQPANSVSEASILLSARTAPHTDTATPQPQITVSFTTEGLPAAGQAVDQKTEQPSAAASAISSSSATGVQAPDTAALANDPLIVQNKYGQIITIHQGSGIDQETVPANGAGKTAAPATEGQRLDINGNYIHSHLPKETPDKAPDEGNGRQQDTTAQTRQQETGTTSDQVKTNPAVSEQAVLQKPQPTFGPETAPLLFAHQQNGGLQTSNSATTPSSLFQLPSGLAVPEGTVVDQMIAHFSINKRLETGTVNLRLYPQELGELRMEIKVEQDNVKAHIIAQNPQAQEMLDRHLPRLREALEQQGLNLQQVEVTIAAHDHTGNERFQENSTWRQPPPSSSRISTDQPTFTLEPDDISGDEHLAANTLSVLA